MITPLYNETTGADGVQIAVLRKCRASLLLIRAAAHAQCSPSHSMKKLSALFLITILPSVAYANVVWPALYTETKVSSVPIICLSLIIEFFFFKWLFGTDVKKTLFYTISANLASGLIGLVARPLSGIVYELSLGMLINWLFSWGTFNPVAWFFVPFFGGAVNAGIEIGTIRLVWKERVTKKRFFLTLGVNALTVGIATIWVIKNPPQM